MASEDETQARLATVENDTVTVLHARDRPGDSISPERRASSTSTRNGSRSWTTTTCGRLRISPSCSRRSRQPGEATSGHRLQRQPRRNRRARCQAGQAGPEPAPRPEGCFGQRHRPAVMRAAPHRRGSRGGRVRADAGRYRGLGPVASHRPRTWSSPRHRRCRSATSATAETCTSTCRAPRGASTAGTAVRGPGPRPAWRLRRTVRALDRDGATATVGNRPRGGPVVPAQVSLRRRPRDLGRAAGMLMGERAIRLSGLRRPVVVPPDVAPWLERIRRIDRLPGEEIPF